MMINAIKFYYEKVLGGRSGGLRRSELINLKVVDVDSSRMLIKICGAKGNKDCFTLLSEKLGHASTKTTEVYTRVASNALMKIKNPLDSINS